MNHKHNWQPAHMSWFLDDPKVTLVCIESGCNTYKRVRVTKDDDE